MKNSLAQAAKPSLELFPALLCEVLHSLAGESGLKRRAALLDRLRAILSEGFDPAWLPRNQKFDLSFSSLGPPSLRFSWSDFGERESFNGKLARIFELFGAEYDRRSLGAVLRTLPEGSPHQTTFGLEWKQGSPFPRLKVYFEELRHHYTAERRRALAESLRRSMRIATPRVTAKEDVAALCADFMPSGEIGMKIYGYRTWRSLDADASECQRRFLGNMLRERRCFFYRMLRGARPGLESSVKLYKVYEVGQISDFSPAILEIYEALSRAGAKEALLRIDRFRRLVSSRGAQWYPVLCAFESDRDGRPRVDAYFSFR